MAENNKKIVRRVKAGAVSSSAKNPGEKKKVSTAAPNDGRAVAAGRPRKISAEKSEKIAKKSEKSSSAKKAAKPVEKVREKAAKTPTKFVKDENGREVSEKMAKKLAKKAAKHPGKKHFWGVVWIFWIGRYFRESWRELRAVEWTNRKATWALTLAVLAFTAFFAIFVLLFDWLFQWIVKEIIL